MGGSNQDRVADFEFDLKTFGMKVPFVENFSPVAATVRSRFQATNSEDTTGWNRLVE
jgi:hypothetical protein